jgi:hypothetical protein
MSVPAYEKLGVFYLGKTYDPTAGAATDELLLYDAKDLTTHGVCVGMTGSGKTGLCLSLLEEAALDGIPVLAIDPKGDLGNLLLTFPELRPEDFQPWIDEGEAARKGLDVPAYAARTAETWRQGLAAWDIDPARLRTLREKADFAVYTPGSAAGLPLCLLRSFQAPPLELADDAEAVRDRVSSTASGLLALLGIQADPLRSREHILVSNLLSAFWAKGEDLDLPALIHAIQKPPFTRIGVMDLESFFPAADRLALAMNLNNLLASPGFAAWMEGEPLDIQRLLFTPAGQPRVSILSIAHLSDGERMFFVTQVLNEVVAWMRRQAGTGSLRALLYMDEIFGFFPPNGEPPSKRPMLLLLKQARAFGLGVLLATQNPVDLDYKGLGNTGTWFIGRLQTERDKLRVLDGLEGAAAGSGQAFDRAALDRLLSGLGNRVFLLNNVHEDAPVLLQTRWCMSYLRGPLTRPQLSRLMAERKAGGGAPAPVAAAPTAVGAAGPSNRRPMLPPGVREVFLPAEGAIAPTYQPWARAQVTLHYVDAKTGTDVWRTLAVLGRLNEEAPGPDWQADTLVEPAALRGQAEPAADATWLPLPPAAAQAATYKLWSKQLETWLYQSAPLTLHRCPELKLAGKAGESAGDFRARLAHAAREARDVEIEKVRRKYAPKLATLQDRTRRAEVKLEKEKAQYGQQKLNTTLSFGATLLGALLGRKAMSASTLSRAGTSISRAGRTASERADVQRAEEEIGVTVQKLEELQAELQAEVDALTARYHPDTLAVEEISLPPRKSDLVVNDLGLAWKPV